MDLVGFCEQLRTALYQCGQVALALKGKVAREQKVADSAYQTSTSVGEVDRLCQEIILLKAYEIAPSIEIHSEELAACPPQICDLFVGNRDRYALIVDPLDGTELYFEGGIQYAHMVGVLDQETGRMECGLVYFPETAKLYYGIRGQGSFVIEGIFGPARPIEPPTPGRTVGEIKRLRSADYEAFARAGFVLDTCESKSVYEQICVAEGRLGAMVMRHFHGHDTAIASVIIEEVGGLVLGPDGNPVRYEKAMPRMELIISALVPQYAVELYAALS
jgi:fructose-1,6-bisphosphatase/inositol monophosphatase family enzyme